MAKTTQQNFLFQMNAHIILSLFERKLVEFIRKVETKHIFFVSLTLGSCITLKKIYLLHYNIQIFRRIFCIIWIFAINFLLKYIIKCRNFFLVLSLKKKLHMLSAAFGTNCSDFLHYKIRMCWILISLNFFILSLLINDDPNWLSDIKLMSKIFLQSKVLSFI